MTVYTVGHGTRSTAELASLLWGGGVGRLFDVRRHPGSRRHPHLARDALERSLPDAGIEYEWWGEHFGGRRSTRRDSSSRHPAWRNESFRAYADYMDTGDFTEALARLERAALSEPPLAIMCAETLWWRCHRRLIADSLWLHDFEVEHLIDEDTRQVHRPHPALRADEQGRAVYDVGVTGSLLEGEG